MRVFFSNVTILTFIRTNQNPTMKHFYFLLFVCSIQIATASDRLLFIENRGDVKNEKGQTENASYYLSTTSFDLFVYPNQISYQFKNHKANKVIAEKITLQLQGANSSVVVENENEVEKYWLNGQDRKTTTSLLVREVYPGS